MEIEKVSDMGKIGYIQGVLKGILENHSQKFTDPAHINAIARAKDFADDLGDSLMKLILK